MSEADWWLCSGCSSLNNLSARKCYSCGQRKPKHAPRASEYLGYVPVVSWDGKVSLEQLPLESAPQPAQAEPRPQAGPVLPPPIREPLPRDTLAVAPRPPHPARITYRPDPQPRPTPAPYVMPTPSGPAGRAVAPPGTPGLSAPSPGPIVAVGPGPVAVPPNAAEQWPHWRELFDGPTPRAEQLRPASEDSLLAQRVNATHGAAGHGGSTLLEAMQQARGDGTPSHPFVPWPEADLRHRGAGETDPDESSD